MYVCLCVCMCVCVSAPIFGTVLTIFLHLFLPPKKIWASCPQPSQAYVSDPFLSSPWKVTIHQLDGDVGDLMCQTGQVATQAP